MSVQKCRLNHKTTVIEVLNLIPDITVLFYRDFIEKEYVGIKQENPSLPILIRECSNVEPKIYARYGKTQA